MPYNATRWWVLAGVAASVTMTDALCATPTQAAAIDYDIVYVSSAGAMNVMNISNNRQIDARIEDAAVERRSVGATPENRAAGSAWAFLPDCAQRSLPRMRTS